MGEHKLREEKNGDEKEPLSSHIVEVGDFAYLDGWGPGIEEMYGRLKNRAEADNSLILAVVQHISVYPEPAEPGVRAEPRLVVILTAQRIGKDDWERQQRNIQLLQGGPRR